MAIIKRKKEYSPELIEEVTLSPNLLTSREQELLNEVAQGFSNQEIADELFLSNGTVRNYLTCIFSKLNASNRTDTVRIAQEKGWL